MGKKLNILFINCPIRTSAKPNCVPTGLAQVAQSARKTKAHPRPYVEIYDINGDRPRQRHPIYAKLLERDWDIIALSGLITTYRFQKWLISYIKQHSSRSVIVSGGGLATSCPELMLSSTQVDIVAIGEGEDTIKDIIMSGGNIGTNIINACDLRKPKFFHAPAYHLLPMEKYIKNPIWGETAGNSSVLPIPSARSMNVVTSRGCPFSCNYCYHLFGKMSYRQRPAPHVVAEVRLLIETYNLDFIGFVDDNMMNSANWMNEFCRLLTSECPPVLWGCHGRVSSAHPSRLKTMYDAGCRWIGYGIESGSQKILDLMNKQTKVQTARNTIRITMDAGIYPNTTFIFGYPGEDAYTIEETIKFKQSLGIKCGSFFATPYPKTVLYETARSRIESQFPTFENYVLRLGDATDFVINLTDIPNEKLFELKWIQDNT